MSGLRRLGGLVCIVTICVGIMMTRQPILSLYQLSLSSSEGDSPSLDLVRNKRETNGTEEYHDGGNQKNNSGFNFRVVVTMTTIPSRIHDIEPTLDSLLQNQVAHIDQFYLVLPRRNWRTKNLTKYNNSTSTPPFLEKYLTLGKVTLLRPEFDYGPVDKMLHTLLQEKNHPDCRIIYLDDDVIYHPSLVQNLLQKSTIYPNDALGFSGTKLRSHFRQIAWRRPSEQDRHPNLFFPISGTLSFPPGTGDMVVDVLQGFTGVLIQPCFFHYQEFLELVQNATLVDLIWKADDFLISGYLEKQNIKRILVEGGTFPKLNARPSKTDNMSKMMHVQTMEVVWYLQKNLNIWSDMTFVDYLSLPKNIVDLIHCEAGIEKFCTSSLVKNDNDTSSRNTVTQRIDQALGI